MIKIKSKIISFGSFVPENIVTNDDLSKIVDTNDEWIKSRTGISQRHISTKENTSDLCTKVASIILANCGVSADEIDLIIIATISPDSLMPSTACTVQRNIGAKNAFAFDINAACSGFIYALSIADKYISGGVYKNALVIGGEILSKLADWEDRATCVLFGDGAGGVLVTQDENHGILGEDLHADGDRSDALTAFHFPVNDTLCQSKKFEPAYIKMDGKKTFDFAVKSVPVSINAVLEKSGYTLDDIKYIVPHQANFRIIEAISKKQKIGMDKFYTNIHEYGNTSSASIPIALHEMYRKGLIQPGNGDKIILVGFGGGLTWGSILLEI